MTAPDPGQPCPRCAELVAGLQARLQFRPCAYAAPGAARCEVRMPDGRITRGRLCLPHMVLLSARPAFGVAVLGEEDGACQWTVPAEEAADPDGVAQQAPREVPVPEEVTA